MLRQLFTQDWSAGGHAAAIADVISLVVGLGALAGLLLLLLRALLVRQRYRAVGALSPVQQQELRDSIGAAERSTCGELAVVVLEESDRHPQACWLSALLFAVTAGTLLAGESALHHPAGALAIALGAGGLGYTLARLLPDYRQRFISRARAEEMAEEQALQEFAALGVHRTHECTGVLILVSLLEREVVVLADEGIHSRVQAEVWLEVNRKILEGIRSGSLARGLLAGIAEAGAILAHHAPPPPGLNRNELPDHLVLRRR